MNSEELAQLELRLTKVMAGMEARLTSAIHHVRTDLSREVADLRSDISGLHGGLKYGNVLLGAIGLSIAAAIAKYLLTRIHANPQFSSRQLLWLPTELNRLPGRFHGLTPTAERCRGYVAPLNLPADARGLCFRKH